jgi:hypothetical protein
MYSLANLADIEIDCFLISSIKEIVSNAIYE